MVMTRGMAQRLESRLRKIPVPVEGIGANNTADYPAFWARITGVAGGVYQWTLVMPNPATAGGFDDTTVTGTNASEVNGRPCVVGSIVRMWFGAPAADGSVTYLFVGVGSVFGVLVSAPSGAGGSSSSDCTFAYTVKSLAGADLADGASPTAVLKTPELNVRLPNTTYTAAPDNSIGTAVYDMASPPGLHLLTVLEMPYSVTGSY